MTYIVDCPIRFVTIRRYVIHKVDDLHDPESVAQISLQYDWSHCVQGIFSQDSQPRTTHRIQTNLILVNNLPWFSYLPGITDYKVRWFEGLSKPRSWTFRQLEGSNSFPHLSSHSLFRLLFLKSPTCFPNRVTWVLLNLNI